MRRSWGGLDDQVLQLGEPDPGLQGLAVHHEMVIRLDQFVEPAGGAAQAIRPFLTGFAGGGGFVGRRIRIVDRGTAEGSGIEPGRDGGETPCHAVPG